RLGADPTTSAGSISSWRVAGGICEVFSQCPGCVAGKAAASAWRHHDWPLRYGKGMPRISSKHQVTLPVETLKRAGLSVGDEVAIEAEGSDRIVVRRVSRD